MRGIIPFPVWIIPFSVWITPFPVLKIDFEFFGRYGEDVVRDLKVGGIIPFPVWKINIGLLCNIEKYFVKEVF